MKKKVLIVVAHPDDETIWMGGTIIRNSILKNKWDVTIISLCRGDDVDRAPKFFKVANLLRAKSFMSNLEDEKLTPLGLDEIKKRILEFAKRDYDYIFTHGENGEYGHIRHKEVHNAVIDLVKKNKLRCRKLIFFSYEKKGIIAIAKDEPDKFINLNSIILLKKRELIHNVYGFQVDGFEYNCCRNVEGFDFPKDKNLLNKMMAYKKEKNMVVSIMPKKRIKSEY